jgi:hypothetical protein
VERGFESVSVHPKYVSGKAYFDVAVIRIQLVNP